MTKILYWFYKLSWKKVAGLGTLILIVAIIPVSLQVVTKQTRTRSEAALIQPSAQPITKEFETPQGLPKIYLVDHFFGKTGDSVLIHGENLGGLHENSWVSLGGVKIEMENLVSWTGNYIEFKVPAGARSGQVAISILGNQTRWPGMFFVVDENTAAEVNFLKNQQNLNQAVLTGIDLNDGRELLVWLLLINNTGEIDLEPDQAVNLNSRTITTPLGKIYEISFNLSANTAQASLNQAVPLLTVTKADNQLIGIARAELATSDGRIIPLKVNPLFVSF